MNVEQVFLPNRRLFIAKHRYTHGSHFLASGFIVLTQRFRSKMTDFIVKVGHSQPPNIRFRVSSYFSQVLAAHGLVPSLSGEEAGDLFLTKSKSSVFVKPKGILHYFSNLLPALL